MITSKWKSSEWPQEAKGKKREELCEARSTPEGHSQQKPPAPAPPWGHPGAATATKERQQSYG